MKNFFSKRNVVVFSLIWLVVVVALLASSITLMVFSPDAGAAGKYTKDRTAVFTERYSRLNEIYEILVSSYYQEVDEEELVLGAIRGMMASLDDPYTYYYTPEELAEYMSDNDGEYAGLGVLVTLGENGGVEILRVYDGSSAMEVGLQVGDLIIAVDGVAYTEYSTQALDAAVDAIRGEPGTSVTITVLRGEEEFEVSVVRAQVHVDYTEWRMLDNDIGYICISQFTGNALENFELAIEDLKANGARGVVIDLRNNPGGYLDYVVDMLDMVLPEGLLVYIQDREGDRVDYTSDAECWEIPMVVLINGNSASASEIFSAAIQDYSWGTLIGETTFGKGIVQTMLMFHMDGSAVQLTTESYYTPNGVCIHGTGVSPDIELALDENYVLVDGTVDLEADNQLIAAIEELENLIGE